MGDFSNISLKIYEFDTRDEYQRWLATEKPILVGSENHTSSPFVWQSKNGEESFIGGCDDFIDYAKRIEASSE